MRSTAQHSTAQHSTAQHSTAQHKLGLCANTQQKNSFFVAVSLIFLFLTGFSTQLFAQANTSQFYISENTPVAGLNQISVSDSTSNAFIYVAKNAIITGLDHCSTAKIVNQTTAKENVAVTKGVFYIKENTLFFATNTTDFDIVYLYEKHEKKAVSNKHKEISKIQEHQAPSTNNCQPTTIISQQKNPFQTGFSRFSNNNAFVVLQNQTQTQHKTFKILINKHTNPTQMVLKGLFANTKSINTYAYNTSKHKTGILSLIYSRPPPSPLTPKGGTTSVMV